MVKNIAVSSNIWDIPDTAYATLESHTGDRRADEATAEAQRLHDEDVEKYYSGKPDPEYEEDPHVVGERQIEIRKAIFGE